MKTNLLKKKYYKQNAIEINKISYIKIVFTLLIKVITFYIKLLKLKILKSNFEEMLFKSSILIQTLVKI